MTTNNVTILKALDLYSIIFDLFLSTMPMKWDRMGHKLVHVSDKKFLYLRRFIIYCVIFPEGVLINVFLLSNQLLSKDPFLTQYNIASCFTFLCLGIFYMLAQIFVAEPYASSLCKHFNELKIFPLKNLLISKGKTFLI